MAKQYQNEKGFLIIEMNKEEAASINFGIYGTGECICMGCNEIIQDNIYYIAVLNDCMCKECCDNFIKHRKRYPEDISYELCKYNEYALLLNIE